jgi:hypothetical protein
MKAKTAPELLASCEEGALLNPSTLFITHQ